GSEGLGKPTMVGPLVSPKTCQRPRARRHAHVARPGASREGGRYAPPGFVRRRAPRPRSLALLIGCTRRAETMLETTQDREATSARAQAKSEELDFTTTMRVTKRNGTTEPVDLNK